MRRFDGRMNLGGGMKNVETQGNLQGQRFCVMEQSPLKVVARIEGRLAYHVESGLLELRRRFAGRRIVALLPRVAGPGDGVGAYLNALSFADVTIIADDEHAGGQRLSAALTRLGCTTQLVETSADLERGMGMIERLADVIVWIGPDGPERK